MNKIYTIIESAQEGAILVSYNDTETAIVLQEYSDEEYKEFMIALDKWELLFVDKSWSEEGIETGDYEEIFFTDVKSLPLTSDNILIKNGKVVGFVLGEKHYREWKTSGETVLMFFDGTYIGFTKYSNDYVWGDYPSETTYYHDNYSYKLVKKTLPDEILKKYSLNNEYISRFDKSVQDLLYIGIQMFNCFEEGTRPDFDLETMYISFCKAIEIHLNKTLVPVIKKICPGIINDPVWRNQSLKYIHTVLTIRQTESGRNVVDEIIQYCQEKQITEYPKSWWDFIINVLLDIKDYRDNGLNKIEKTEVKSLLTQMFGNPKGGTENALMIGCTNLYNDILKINTQA